MRAVIQRVSKASVSVAGRPYAAIEKGLLVFLGVEADDKYEDASYLVEKTARLRIFEDSEKKMNSSVEDIGGAVLVVPQFTLFGDVRHGLRPNFHRAAPPAQAEILYLDFVARLRSRGLRVETGVFQEMMQVGLTNHGPVTILLDSKKIF